MEKNSFTVNKRLNVFQYKQPSLDPLSFAQHLRSIMAMTTTRTARSLRIIKMEVKMSTKDKWFSELGRDPPLSTDLFSLLDETKIIK